MSGGHLDQRRASLVETPPTRRFLAPGTRVASRYIVAQRIGQGGGGAVYAAVDTRFGMPVAVKVLVSEAPEARERFQREARLGNRLGQASAGLVRCHDQGELAGGRLFLVMDLVDGAQPLDVSVGPLAQRLERLDRAALLVAELHDLGIVHRDIKPSNFLLDRQGRVFLSDFGLARDLRAPRGPGLEALTRAGDALGTPMFMAPEQFDRAGQADERADVYALGVMLFMALCGRPPFPGDPLQVIARQLRVTQRTAPAPRPRDAAPDVHPALDALCARTLVFDPGRRTPSARLFARELRRAAAQAGAADTDDRGPAHADASPGRSPAPGLELDEPTVEPELVEEAPEPRPPARALRFVDPRSGRARRVELRSPLASGARGATWLARGEDGAAAVVKVPRPHARGALDLEVEARILEQLDHPNVVRLLGRGEGGALCLERAFANPLLVMNHPDARARLFKDPGSAWYPLPPGTALELAHDLLAGLEYLHALGFVHHDVKLGNFLVALDPPGRRGPPREDALTCDDEDVLLAVAEGRGRGVLIDLGAARSVAWLEDLAQGRGDRRVPPQLTPLYAPPEALLLESGRGSSPAVDVYAAGLVLYAMVTGHLAYDHLPGFGGGGAQHDLGRLLEVKLAERGSHLRPITRDALEALPLYDVRFTGGERRAGRQRFVTDLWALLERLVDPDPDTRPSAGVARALLARLFGFQGAGRPRQGTFRMDPRSNRLVDAARVGGPVARITVDRAALRGRGAHGGGRRS